MSQNVQKFVHRCREALDRGSWVKLTLGTPRDSAAARNVIVRPVALRDGLRLSFVHRYAARDITKNLPVDDGLRAVADLLDADYAGAHLFTTEAEFELRPSPRGGEPRLSRRPPRHGAPAPLAHDRPRAHAFAPSVPWLRTLGVTRASGSPRADMADKLRQIQKFAEILLHAMDDLPARADRALDVVDMGCGKGYLTFAAFETLRGAGWTPLRVTGVERRADLVDTCNRAAAAHGLDGLSFVRGGIADAPLDRVDVLVALHACDTATDDALARGIQAGAALILASPCCHKELRPAIRPPPPLAVALRHGILLERHAELVTDALRAGLLEWAGYRTRVFEFIGTEHTARNVMIAAVRRPGPARTDEAACAVRDLAAFHGLKSQRLAARLDFPFVPA